MIISSRNNEGIKFVRSLIADKKARKQSGLFVVEGINFVCDIKKSVRLEKVYYTAEAYKKQKVAAFLSECDCEIAEVTPSVMDAMSDVVAPSGLLAIAKIPDHAPVNGDRVIILDGVSDPGNVGTIIRSAAAFGFSSVIASEELDFYAPKIVRATMTGLFSVNLVNTDLDLVLSKLKKEGYSLVALDMNGTPLRDIQKSERIALVIGSEAHGISADVRNNADIIASIPMKGNVESLNAAVAASIAMHDLMR